MNVKTGVSRFLRAKGKKGVSARVLEYRLSLICAKNAQHIYICNEFRCTFVVVLTVSVSTLHANNVFVNSQLVQLDCYPVSRLGID